ncbi:type I-E CRISPR-associated protein Cas5/CasD [Kitasatospora sp. NPDC088783]|uniref:type I-E CRISPR-associated protein Cas5/CasD n=1 Tax=Kitasatospora sp. NPDC088783 TaxID=3364077 RepID=UPI00380BA70D
MSRGVLLHLSGPLQSWGGPKGGKVRDTYPVPTRSGVTGMLAAVLGRPRGSDIGDLEELSHLVRVDRPGKRVRDFQTVGGGLPKERTVVTAGGDRRGDALLFDSWYLADAAFTVALFGPDEVVAQVAGALRCPHFPPYLGRRSCPPATPVLIAESDEVEDLLLRMPLHRPKPQAPWGKEAPPVRVAYIAERAPAAEPGRPATRHVPDVGLAGRSWTSRPVWESHRSHPAEQCGGYGTEFVSTLTAWREGIAA